MNSVVCTISNVPITLRHILLVSLLGTSAAMLISSLKHIIMREFDWTAPVKRKSAEWQREHRVLINYYSLTILALIFMGLCCLMMGGAKLTIPFTDVRYGVVILVISCSAIMLLVLAAVGKVLKILTRKRKKGAC